jgi:transcriptional regulator with XRE-family HTH domain
MHLRTGPQLRAARAMAGMGQEKLAALAGVTPNTVRRLEAAPGAFRTTTVTADSLQRVLEAAGVEFIPKGVRQREPAEAAQ